MQWTTRLNEAYRVLRDPVQRGKHLLELHGVAFETNTQMPTDFLLQQLEMREQLEEALGKKDAAFLDSLRKSLLEKRKSLEALVGERIDRHQDFKGAAELVRKLMFLQKIDDEIDAAYEAIE
jgi:molecular chaperone HscB